MLVQMAYDKAKWHYEGEYPTGLSKQQAFVHTGMFIAWAITAEWRVKAYRRGNSVR
ncbi:hypothetical protein JYJ95_02695 [Corallococcus exiguus]|uniref:DUF7832 domain-containing protein n=1 Tax=Corallococcus exiguus TaxID=83462 RepID=UPI001A8CA45D|nr:hypothetical protein [Corallococcus exiguus]MBN8465403.1 hypothetical protein [Corallococcus exiguus]